MFNININCVIFGVNVALNKKCILSLNESDIEFPKLSLQEDQTDDINTSIVKFLKNFIFINDLELIPQIITLNHSILKSSDVPEINVVYGFIIDYKSSIDTSKVYWLNFDILKEHKYSSVIFEVMQKLS